MSSESQFVEERFVPAPTDDRDVEAEHRRAQQSGEVFEGESTVQHQSGPGRSSRGRPLMIV